MNNTSPFFTLHLGDCLESMRGMADNSVDSIVTDPPYLIGFMGRDWDHKDGIAGKPEVWRECLRVLKPGGHLLSFAGARTYHRIACSIEDAGFEIRDQIMYLYGSGFPKSLDVSKAIDKARDDSAEGASVGAWLKAQREAHGIKQKEVAALWLSATGGLTGCAANWEALGKVPKWDQWLKLKEFIGFGDEMDAEVWRLNGRKGQPGEAWQTAEVIGIDRRMNEASGIVSAGRNERVEVERQIKSTNSESARQWSGWGTALKPAHEPICVARKPLGERTVAANVLQWGTGAVNIDGTRITTDENLKGGAYAECGRLAPIQGDERTGAALGMFQPGAKPDREFIQPSGRWPANIILENCPEVVAGFPVTGKSTGGGKSNADKFGGGYAPTGDETIGCGDTGSAARFFKQVAPEAEDLEAARFMYCAKASRKDRDDGLEGFEAKSCTSYAGAESRAGKVRSDGATQHATDTVRRNTHMCVKPTDLMAYLCRLVTPPGGVVLDPFMGSGSTGKAAIREGFNFIGCELDPEYLEIARARIQHEVNKIEAARAPAVATEPAPQLDLFTA